MKASVGTILIGIVVVLVIASLSLFTVDQRQNAIVFRLGEIVSVKTSPGLYFKMPLVDNVRFFDVRILTLDPTSPSASSPPRRRTCWWTPSSSGASSTCKQYYISVGRRRSARAASGCCRP